MVRVLASGEWLTRGRVYGVASISAAAGIAMLLFLWLAGQGTLDYFGQPVGSDFSAFWEAGRIANAGEPARAWDQKLLNNTIAATHGVEYGTAWIYPPVFLLLAAPLAAVPYLPALALWQLLSLIAIGLLLKAILTTRHETAIALASPLTPLVLANGQNSLLTAALLGGGLLLLGRRQALAGCLFGGLIYKPQLGLVIAPLLLFTKSWPAFAGAAGAALGLVFASVLVWGVESWQAFAASLSYGRFYMEQGSVGFHKSASLFSMARQWGAPVNVGYAVQLLGMLLAVLIVWRSSKAVPNIRAAAVCAAAALSTPYLLDYDLAVVGVGAAFLYAEARTTRFLDWERSALAFIWVAPWITRPAAEYAVLPLGPMAILVLAWLAWRRTRQGIAMPPLTCSVCPVT
jgi:alpha-1,2-mannosyltransferase